MPATMLTASRAVTGKSQNSRKTPLHRVRLSRIPRRQATLSWPPPHSESIESLRARYNPAQFAPIREYVTLCLEDEVSDGDAFATRLDTYWTAAGPFAVTLEFGAPQRDGDLVLLPVRGSTASFDELRALLLAPSVATDGVTTRTHRPHLKLVHPRNGRCSDEDFEAITRAALPFSATFRGASLIEQLDGGPWRDVATYD